MENKIIIEGFTSSQLLLQLFRKVKELEKNSNSNNNNSVEFTQEDKYKLDALNVDELQNSIKQDIENSLRLSASPIGNIIEYRLSIGNGTHVRIEVPDHNRVKYQ